MEKILVVDDENDIAELIKDILEDEGYKVDIRNDGNGALEAVKENAYDLILLDIMMPDLSGTEVCASIRSITSVPIIFVTAKTQLTSKLVGFEVGADDYITKPFINEELVARVKAHIRREGRIEKNKNNNFITIGEIKINKESFEVYKNDTLIKLSTKEF